MIGRTAVGHRRAFLIEWKYTESYRQENKYIPARASVYDDLIRAPDSPFKPIEPRALYFEPFYQMMRQTLLGWQMTKHEDDYYRCTSYRHVHVIPEQNSELRGNVTSPLLNGTDMCDVWRNQVLKEPTFYSETSPSNFMKPVLDARDAKALTDYLARRYWSAV
jgi:hypothetical protein